MKRHLTLALLGTLAFAPCAFAQDAGTAGGKRFAVVGGYALSEPTGNVDLASGSQAELDGDGAPTLSASWFVNDNIAVEAWGADKFGHRVRSANGAKAGSVNAQPYAVSGQYHFGTADRTVRPFLGIGYYQMNFDDEVAQGGGALSGRRVGIDTAQGPMATAGVDLNISPTWFARTDVRYLHGDSDLQLNGVNAGTAEASPVVVGVGIGARW